MAVYGCSGVQGRTESVAEAAGPAMRAADKIASKAVAGAEGAKSFPPK